VITAATAGTKCGPLMIALCVACLAAGGCQPNVQEAALEEYLERLARTLEVEPPPLRPITLAPPPRPGALSIKRPLSSLDTLDFLSLTGCAVQVTIGKRNSSLGRTAPPSQRLLLDLEYLRLAPECIAHQRASRREDLADTLERAWHAKREQLPAAIFNATLGSAEYRQLWRPSIGPGEYPAATGGQVITALAAVNGLVERWLAGDYRADNREFEIFLGEVATGDGGALLSALARQGTWLAGADAALARRELRGPLCAPGVRHAAADILPNVVQRFFIEGIQPYSASLAARYHEVVPPVKELESRLAGTLPAPFLAWQAQRDALLDELTAAPRRHVEALKAAMAPCGGIAAPP
jgi:hypothetical protein